jgi:hypothetical protein
LLLSSTIDVFDMRASAANATSTALTGDLGLLHAVDERLATYGFETTTGVRFVVVVDMRGGKGGRAVGSAAGKGVIGLREGDLKPVSFFLVFFLTPPIKLLGEIPSGRGFNDIEGRFADKWEPGVQGASIGVYCSLAEPFLRSR